MNLLASVSENRAVRRKAPIPKTGGLSAHGAERRSYQQAQDDKVTLEQRSTGCSVERADNEATWPAAGKGEGGSTIPIGRKKPRIGINRT